MPARTQLMSALAIAFAFAPLVVGFVGPAPRRAAPQLRRPSAAPGAAEVDLDDGWEVTMSGLKYKDDLVGEGEAPEKGDIVKVDYTGWLTASGFMFDSSATRGKPFAFKIGDGNVIPGWDE